MFLCASILSNKSLLEEVTKCLFRRVDSVVFVLCAKFGSNTNVYVIVTEIDALMLLTFI